MKLAWLGSPSYRGFVESTGGDELSLVREALAERGWSVTLVDGCSLRADMGFDAVVPLGFWGYHTQPADFLSMVSGLHAQGVAVVNAPDVLRWNVDKRYLLDLARAGISIAPLRAYPQHAVVNLREELEQAGWTRYVMKPAISANALRTQVFTGGVDATAEALAQEILQDTGLLLQPFFEEIVETGELSLLYFGGTFSHAVCKVPKPGDFRSQPSHGARISRFSPSPALREQAEAILRATPGTQPLAYARIDGFLRGDRFHVIELELIEPFLFLQDAPDPRAAARQLAESLLFAAQGSRR